MLKPTLEPIPNESLDAITGGEGAPQEPQSREPRPRPRIWPRNPAPAMSCIPTFWRGKRELKCVPNLGQHDVLI